MFGFVWASSTIGEMLFTERERPISLSCEVKVADNVSFQNTKDIHLLKENLALQWKYGYHTGSTLRIWKVVLFHDIIPMTSIVVTLNMGLLYSPVCVAACNISEEMGRPQNAIRYGRCLQYLSEFQLCIVSAILWSTTAICNFMLCHQYSTDRMFKYFRKQFLILYCMGL